MPYGVSYNMDDMWDEDLDTAEYFVEKNKDEVIDRLIWLLRRLEHNVTVEYPDGEVW